MRSRVRTALVAAVASTLVVSACGSQPKQTVAPDLGVVPSSSPVYDPHLEPAAAVLSLVPASATRLVVDDYEQTKLDLGFDALTSASPASEKAKYASALARKAVTFGVNLLAADDAQLRATYGFGADDVAWQAQFTGPDGAGWALKLDDTVPDAGPEAAVKAKNGPLAGSTYYPGAHVVLHDGTTDFAHSWRADPDLTDLVGQVAAATYVQRSCVPFATAFGDGVQQRLAPGSSKDLAGLDALGPFSVSYGSTLVTAQLGPLRDDAFDRARLAQHLPSTDPDFGRGYGDAVADPGGGRIGFSIVDPRVAAQLALDQRLPFAVCADQ